MLDTSPHDALTSGANVFAQRVDLVNKLLQIIALLVAGGWALWTWQQISAPSLLTGLAVAGELKTEWSSSSAACWGSFTITVENVGQKTISVARAVYEIAKAAPQTLGAGKELKIVGSLPASAEPIVDGDFDPPILVQEFVPKARAHQTLNFLLHPEDDKEYWFKGEIFDGANQSLGYWFGVVDVEACQKEKESKKPK